MSLTKEDLQAISDLIDVKLNEQEKRFDDRFDKQDKRFDAIDKKFEQIDKRFEQIDKRFEQIDKRFDEQDKNINDRFDEQDKKINDKFDEQEKRFKEMLIDNNILIAEHVQRVVSESEKRLSKEIQEIKIATAQNSYDIAVLKQKIS